MGRRRPRRLRQRRALARRAGPRRRRAPGDPRRQRQRLHDALRDGLQRRVHGRHELLRDRRPRDVPKRDPQVRVALRPDADRPAGRRRSSSTTTARRSTSSTGSCPVLILQGAEDRVVPPAQAEEIVDALWEKRLPHAYLLFPGEDHGFRAAENIIRSFEAELSFYGQVFGFTPATDRADRGRPRARRGAWRPGDPALGAIDAAEWAPSRPRASRPSSSCCSPRRSSRCSPAGIGIPYPILLVARRARPRPSCRACRRWSSSRTSSSSCSSRRSCSGPATSPRPRLQARTCGRSSCSRSGSS